MEEFNINIEILKRLSKGMMYQEISDDLKELGITPNSVSSIDKKTKKMRDEMKCRTVMELMYKAGKLKLI
jgi:hypothetical protein